MRGGLMRSNLTEYLTGSIENIIKDSLRVAFDNPRETAFLMRFGSAAGKAAKRRETLEKAGEHIPPFLIASITRDCNLRCVGCYAHAVHGQREVLADAEDDVQEHAKPGMREMAEPSVRENPMPVMQEGGACGTSCAEKAAARPMGAADWDKVFAESEELGISFIFLVGGEPLLQRDVIDRAGKHGSILFPIITNGIFIDEAYLAHFDRCRNLLPVLSIEGGEDATDGRRGAGIYQILLQTMERLQQRGLPFGVSITATTENLEEITEPAFVEKLHDRGCKLVLYVDYVATGEADRRLEPAEAHRERMGKRLGVLRQQFDRMVMLSFPGDEQKFGGCLAAGRGFFHISAEGDAEPCPFTPYSDANVRETSVRQALTSRLFTRLKERDMLQEDHSGGCALSGRGDAITTLLRG